MIPKLLSSLLTIVCSSAGTVRRRKGACRRPWHAACDDRVREMLAINRSIMRARRRIDYQKVMIAVLRRKLDQFDSMRQRLYERTQSSETAKKVHATARKQKRYRHNWRKRTGL